MWDLEFKFEAICKLILPQHQWYKCQYWPVATKYDFHGLNYIVDIHIQYPYGENNNDFFWEPPYWTNSVRVLFLRKKHRRRFCCFQKNTLKNSFSSNVVDLDSKKFLLLMLTPCGAVGALLSLLLKAIKAQCPSYLTQPSVALRVLLMYGLFHGVSFLFSSDAMWVAQWLV